MITAGGAGDLAEIRKLPSDVTIVACLQDSCGDANSAADGVGVHSVWAASAVGLFDAVAARDAALAQLLLEPRFTKLDNAAADDADEEPPRTAVFGLTEHRGKPRAYDSRGQVSNPHPNLT